MTGCATYLLPALNETLRLAKCVHLIGNEKIVRKRIRLSRKARVAARANRHSGIGIQSCRVDDSIVGFTSAGRQDVVAAWAVATLAMDSAASSRFERLRFTVTIHALRFQSRTKCAAQRYVESDRFVRGEARRQHELLFRRAPGKTRFHQYGTSERHTVQLIHPREKAESVALPSDNNLHRSGRLRLSGICPGHLNLVSRPYNAKYRGVCTIRRSTLDGERRRQEIRFVTSPGKCHGRLSLGLSYGLVTCGARPAPYKISGTSALIHSEER